MHYSCFYFRRMCEFSIRDSVTRGIVKQVRFLMMLMYFDGIKKCFISFQMVVLSTLLYTFSKSMPVEYSGDSHSIDCSLLKRNPACSGLSSLNNASFILSMITLVKTMLAMDKSMTARQYPHCDRLLFCS